MIKLKRKAKIEDKVEIKPIIEPSKETLEFEAFKKTQIDLVVPEKKKTLNNDFGPVRKEFCEECKKQEFVSNRAEGTIVCTNCGLV